MQLARRHVALQGVNPQRTWQAVQRRQAILRRRIRAITTRQCMGRSDARRRNRFSWRGLWTRARSAKHQPAEPLDFLSDRDDHLCRLRSQHPLTDAGKIGGRMPRTCLDCGSRRQESIKIGHRPLVACWSSQPDIKTGRIGIKFSSGSPTCKADAPLAA